MKMVRFFIIFLLVFLGSDFFSQTTNNTSFNTTLDEVQVETKKLQKAIDNQDEPAQAGSYYNIGETFFNSGNFSKSEE